MKAKKKVAIPRRRLWLFRIVAVMLAPLLFCLCIEVALRLLGYGYPTSAILISTQHHRPTCYDNVRFAWRFFPPYLARVGEPFSFPKKKGKNTCRIFVMGESAAAGTPNPAYSFSRILGVMLRQAYPQTDFEIINTAITAVNSHVVVEIAKDCARYEPDLFIVYLGNNEVVGPFGPGTVFTERAASLPLIQLNKWCKATRLGQLVTAAGAALKHREDRPLQWEGMAMFLDRQIRADDPALQRVYRQFRANLEGIRRAALAGGADVAFCTVGGNLRDCSPFSSLHRIDLKDDELRRWQQNYEQGMAYEQAGKWSDAAQHYLAAERIDCTFAELHFRLARCRWALGEFQQAKAGFVRACDLDALRFRPDTQIKDAIRATASGQEERGVYLVDAAGAFESNSPHGCPGGELFLEHVHLTFAGNYLLAKTVFETLAHRLTARVGGAGPDTAEVATELDCVQRLAYTEWDHHNITLDLLDNFVRQPPFTGQAYHDEWVRRLERQLAQQRASLTPESVQQVKQQYIAAIGQTPNDWSLRSSYGRFLSGAMGDARGATEQFQIVVQHMPHDFRAHVGLGAGLLALGLVRQSIDHNLKAVAIMPTRATAHNNLATAYMRLGQLDKAETHLLLSIRSKPDDFATYHSLVDVYIQRDRLEEAVSLCRRALRLAPDNAMLHCKLGVVLGIQGKREEALEEIRRAYRLDPNSPEIRNVLNTVQPK
jgi:tetratricopeptide (TPR) repeat protein